MREALRRLAALGLVSFEPNRGVRVRSITADELREAFLVRAELEALATEVATPKMTPADLAELDAIERRFGELTLELREHARSRAPRDAGLFVEWMQANYAFHDVIYRVADVPLVERIAKSARRTFLGDRVWSARAELDELYAKNDLQHRAIRETIAAGSATAARGARARARPLVEPADRGRARDARRRRARARAGAAEGAARRSPGARTVTSRSAATSRRVVTRPPGWRTTSALDAVASPSPRWTRGSSDER